MSERPGSSPSIARRTALKGAGVAVGTLWVAPLVQVVSMDSASAASAPPSRVQPSTGGVSAASAESAVSADSAVAASSLPKTGADSAFPLAAVGVGAIAAGSAAVVASRRARARAEAAADLAQDVDES